MEAQDREDVTIETEDNPEECAVCTNPFDQQSRRPRSLPCCHTFCSVCIDNMIKDWHVCCPACRTRHYTTNVSQFSINYSLEGLIRKLNTLQTQYKPFQLIDNSTSPIKPESGIDKLDILTKEQIHRVKGLSSAYGQMQDKLSHCKKSLQALMDDHKHQLNQIDLTPQTQTQRFQDLVRENTDALVLLEKRWECLSSLCQEGDEKCRDLATSLKTLTSTPTHEGMALSIAECDRCISIKDAWFEKCKVEISDNRTVKASQKLLAQTRDALRVTTLTGNIQRSLYSSSNKVEDLLEMTEEIETLLKNDRVFALQQKEEGLRFAKISLKEDKLYLHHLQDNPPPNDAKIFMYNEVYKMADTRSILAFLDFGWNGMEQGRLHVRLDPADTGRARQFALLCTALWGPTYANTRLLAVGNKGLPSELVRGGDYQYNNGTGGASLLPGLRRGGEYWRQQVSGSVMAAGSWGDACSAQFIISTRNPGLAQRDDTIYGQVEDGLHVLNAAIKDARITQVNVTDCGIVISSL